MDFSCERENNTGKRLNTMIQELAAGKRYIGMAYQVKLFLKWLKLCLEISDNDIYFDIYIHKITKKINKQ